MCLRSNFETGLVSDKCMLILHSGAPCFLAILPSHLFLDNLKVNSGQGLLYTFGEPSRVLWTANLYGETTGFF